MLKLQEYLRNGGTPESLKEELGVMFYKHPYLPLVGFKYNQINSPKFHDIVRECRGVVLENETWNLVAKGFSRFYNLGENPEQNLFDWSDFVVTEKCDGSLILLKYYCGEWLVNTSGSFGNGLVGESGLSWEELFWQTSCLDRKDLDPDYTYVFELCTKWNKVVRDYGVGKVFLLSVFDGEYEFDHDYVSVLFYNINYNSAISLPENFSIKNEEGVAELLKNKMEYDATWEGVVLRDKNNNRIKCKTTTYLTLHHLKGEGFTAKRIIPLILNSEIDEVLAYFPEYEEEIKKIADWLQEQYEELVELKTDAGSIESAKEFALYILPRSKFASVLFNSRNKKIDLRSAWIDAVDLITKVYEDGK